MSPALEDAAVAILTHKPQQHSSAVKIVVSPQDLVVQIVEMPEATEGPGQMTVLDVVRPIAVRIGATTGE